MSSNTNKKIAIYFIVQAIAVAVWWAILLIWPASIHWFQPRGWPRETLLSFWLADGVLIVGGSLVTGWLVFTQHRLARFAVWAIAGTALYAAFYCLGCSVHCDDAWLATSMMVSMAGLNVVMGTMFGIEGEPLLVREHRQSPLGASLLTLFQTVIFWTVFLWILPEGIHELTGRMGWHGVLFTPVVVAGWLVFLLGSSLGLWSGITMAVIGRGTPLPTSTAPDLVVSGPYHFVRNPMAMAGVIQGVAVSMWMGNAIITLYAILGAITWHVLVRPFEEQDLEERFGDAYQSYKASVGVWWPRFFRVQ